MANATRLKMIAGTAQLLAKRGLQETTFAEVLELTGAPRGSIYHHFPEGKNQLIASAIEYSGSIAVQFVEQTSGLSAIQTTERFIEMWRKVLLASNFRSGCSVLAVTVATDSDDLRKLAASVFSTWRRALAESLCEGGLSEIDAHRFAVSLIASMEGAVVMSRAESSIEPFDQVSDQLIREVKVLGSAQII